MTTLTESNRRTSSREILLKTAATLMIERGAIDISLSDIAERSQLNSALVKYYFGGRTGLMVALVEDVLGAALLQLDGLVTMNLDPVEKLKLHVKGIISIYFRYPFINRLIHVIFEEAEPGRQIAETIARPLAETQRKLLAEGVAKGVFRPVDPMAFYFIIIGACDHLFFGQHVLRHAFGVKRIDEELRRSYTNTLLDMILGGILTDEAR